ncbi:TIR domain-containing protein [Paludibaculum fermentans]|uniref:AbiJ-related protein n=1 Tax=Paludibaculum fermentans TaxID=1473598 RepID=UPI003EBE09BF
MRDEMPPNRITAITRSDVLDYLLLRKQPFYGNLDLMSFLKRVWSLSQMPSTDSRFENAEGDIWQHMVNNDDWSYSDLLNNRLDLLSCEDETFIGFVEMCVHPILRLDAEVQAETVEIFNSLLGPDGLTLIEDTHISGRPVYKVRGVGGHTNPHERAYEIVLSFAGEQREYVREVAEHLKDNDVVVFFDEYEEATMWGKHLAEHLATVYGGTARYCVMFISKEYAEKVWTTHERRVAFAKAVTEKKEYVLPARFDDTAIPGLSPDVHYISLESKTPSELADLILRKLGRLKTL